MKYNSLREDTQRDWDFSNLYLGRGIDLLKKYASFLVDFEIAPPDIDLKEVGDIVLQSSMGHVGFRVRKPNVTYRDFTIRSRRLSGAETELAKIRKGFCRWYLYCWADGAMPRGNGRFADWILVDMDQFRDCGLAYQDRQEKPNPDGRTWFIFYSISELEDHRCIVTMDNNLLDHPQESNTWAAINQIALEALQNQLAHQEYLDS